MKSNSIGIPTIPVPPKPPEFRQPEISFTTDRILIFHQAKSVEMRHVAGNANIGSDCQLLVFSRNVRTDAIEGQEHDVKGQAWGVEIVAYPCDDNGEVENWLQRYEIEAHEYQAACNKLRFLIVNGLAQMSVYDDSEC